jgi:hypothetical protein
MHILSAFRRLRQENCEFKFSLGYIEDYVSKKNPMNK